MWLQEGSLGMLQPGYLRLQPEYLWLQEGSLGMLRAAELFDPERGIKISTYATW